MEIQIPHAFEPLFRPRRYKAYYGGRGSAKSHSIARALLLIAMQKPTRIVCAREIQKSIKDSVHQLLADIIKEYGLGGFFHVQNDKIVGKNGSLFLFRGLKHNTTDLKSLEGADICWVEEAENVSHNSWEILIPTIRKDGSEIWVSFNTKALTDPTYKRFVKHDDPDIHCQKVSWRDNPFFPEVLNKERIRLQELDPEAYDHIWEGAPDTRRTGYIYAKQIAKAQSEGRITRVPYDPASPVWMAWDLGFGDATSIWWLQFIGRELRWLEYYENSGEQLEHYAAVVRSKSYTYASPAIYLPFDGAHGNIRGLSVEKQLIGMGFKCQVLEQAGIAPGIEQLRQTMAFSCFDEQKCADGLHALNNYQYKFDDKKQALKKDPDHDWSSHAADAARYAAQAAALKKHVPLFTYDPFKNQTQSAGWMGS